MKATHTHTPGPWFSRLRDQYPDKPVRRYANHAVWTNGFCVANCATDADQDLIAAAPDLLSALRALLWQHDHNGGQLCGMALQDARAAIAKATGEG